MLVTNIEAVSSSSTPRSIPDAGRTAPSGTQSPDRPSKRERTLAALVEAGLELFERQGYEATTVAQIARAAGVTEMTFFRYFPAKEHLLLDDPYDPVLTAAIAEQPRELAPFQGRLAASVRPGGRCPNPRRP